MRYKDAGDHICEQIEAIIGSFGQVNRIRERPWASITFTGTRYTLHIVNCQNARELAGLINALSDHPFELRGHFVADLVVVRRKEDLFEIEILVIADS